MKRQSCFAITTLLAVALCWPHVHAADAPLWAPAPSSRIVSEPIEEMSGIVRSPRRDNLYWVHNDSGDSARIFAITADGKSVLPTYSKFTHYGDAAEAGKQQWQGFEVLYADSVDWEDIAADANYLYVADVGNNANMRRNLAIYLISEIDPTASTRSAVIQKLPVVYPEQTSFPQFPMHFDSESLFTVDGKLYLITKNRGGGITGTDFERGANLYRLDTRHTDQPNVLTKIDSNDVMLAATGADVSPDGSKLAVVTYEALWLFDKPADGSDRWLSSTSRRYPYDRAVLKQVEAVTWIDDATLLIGNEQRDLFRIPLATLPAPTPAP